MVEVTMNRHVLAALGFCATMAAVALAQAAVRYELQSQVFLTLRPEFSVGGGYPARSFPLTFTISDEAVSRGSISVSGRDGRSGQGEGTFPLSGDAVDFVSLQAASNEVITPQRVTGNFNLQASFAADRSVTSFFLEANGTFENIVLKSIDGNLVGSSFFASDRIQACTGTNCFIAGRIEVPEPAGAALLSFGLLGLAALRGRS